MAEHILIIDDDAVNRKLSTKVMESEGYQVTTAEDGLKALALTDQQSFDMVISDVMMPNMDGYETCRRLRDNPKTAQLPILLLTSLDNLESKIKGFEAGADDYLAKPYEPDELIARVKVLIRRKSATAPRQALKQNGKIIAVYSLRGGVGVSTVAANLAVSLAQLWGKNVALVDLALTAGQAALMLNLPIRSTWSDLARIPYNEIDQDVLHATLRSHSSGVHVLTAPRHAEEAELIDAPKVTRVLELLQQHYDYILLDTPHNFSATTLAGLDFSDEIIVLLAPELASVRATAMTLDVFDTLEYPRDNIHLVLNWIFERQGLAKTDIEGGLKRNIRIVLPYAADLFVQAINFGTPPVLSAPDSPFGALIDDIAFMFSKADHKGQRPQEPSEAWQRLAKRMRRRRKD